ncbi:MAG: lipopolysaccharide export system permease protein [Rickettsiales bacterium]
MKLYNLYFLRKIFLSFAVILGVLILLIWFSKAISLIKYITESGVSIVDFFNLFILILPQLLLIIAPISLFIAVLVAYSQMISHNEIVVLKNSGLDKLTLAKPAILIATICCLTCFLVSFFLMPYANKKLRTIRTDFQTNYANLLISPGIFENLNSLTIYAKNRDENNMLEGVLIYDNRNNDHSTTITSKSGNINQKGSAILLYLTSGTAQRFSHLTKKSTILHFDSYVINLKDSNQGEALLKWKANERYIDELLYPEKNSTKRDLREYRIEIHERITYPLLSIVFTLIACAFVLSGKFKRHGNDINNFKAIVVAIIFTGILIGGYGVVEKSPDLTPLLYLNILFFAVMSFVMLISKNKPLIFKKKVWKSKKRTSLPAGNVSSINSKK